MQYYGVFIYIFLIYVSFMPSTITTPPFAWCYSADRTTLAFGFTTILAMNNAVMFLLLFSSCTKLTTETRHEDVYTIEREGLRVYMCMYNISSLTGL